MALFKKCCCGALPLLCIMFGSFVIYNQNILVADKPNRTQKEKQSMGFYLPKQMPKKKPRNINSKITFCKLHTFAAKYNQDEADITCVGTNTEPEINICIHPVENDIHVSLSIYATGSWEKDITQSILSQLHKKPEAGFIDIGANIGKQYFHTGTLLNF